LSFLSAFSTLPPFSLIYSLIVPFLLNAPEEKEKEKKKKKEEKVEKKE
jgi:hypothetical protein